MAKHASSIPLLLFLPLLFGHTVLRSNAQPNFLYHFCINQTGNYTTNSTYKPNLTHLLTSIIINHTTSNTNGFYNLSYSGINAIALCRGDLDSTTCLTCLNDSINLLPSLCPGRKEAIGWYDYCMLRYSNRTIFKAMEIRPAFTYWLLDNVTDTEYDVFQRGLQDLLNSLRSKAASPSLTSDRKYAAGSVTLMTPSYKTIYALAQCAPDVSGMECENCLNDIFGRIPACCRSQVKMGTPSCSMRYELYRFFLPTLEEQALQPPPLSTGVRGAPPPSAVITDRKGKQKNVIQIVIAVTLPIAGILFVVICICVFLRITKGTETQADNNADEVSNQDQCLQFDFETINFITDKFSDTNKLGEGGFGAVYKGKLPNGQEVAVKRLRTNSSQGDEEFKNEVVLLAKLQHRNLIRLLGFCLKKEERLLIYEFAPNSSLDHFLFDSTKHAYLDWRIRYKIIRGIARGILYLHEESQLKIIHRDLKSSNILLDEEMNPKITDFGMARLFKIDQTRAITKRIVGTFGYMAPEYVRYGKFSVKSDVFSFGVSILEILTGLTNNSVDQSKNIFHLPTYAWENWREGKASSLIDRKMRGGGSRDEIMRCIHIGLLCIQESVEKRPTMNQVVLMLTSHSQFLPQPSKPGFFLHSTSREGLRPVRNRQLIVEDQPSVNDVTVSVLDPR